MKQRRHQNRHSGGPCTEYSASFNTMNCRDKHKLRQAPKFSHATRATTLVAQQICDFITSLHEPPYFRQSQLLRSLRCLASALRLNGHKVHSLVYYFRSALSPPTSQTLPSRHGSRRHRGANSSGRRRDGASEWLHAARTRVGCRSQACRLAGRPKQPAVLC